MVQGTGWDNHKSLQDSSQPDESILSEDSCDPVLKFKSAQIDVYPCIE